jgi:hypothetical protein
MKRYAIEAAALLALFAAVTGLASLLGAANLGTAATFGQIAFLLGLLYVLLRGR